MDGFGREPAEVQEGSTPSVLNWRPKFEEKKSKFGNSSFRTGVILDRGGIDHDRVQV